VTVGPRGGLVFLLEQRRPRLSVLWAGQAAGGGGCGGMMRNAGNAGDVRKGEVESTQWWRRRSQASFGFGI
jgi:hypothetical protein